MDLIYADKNKTDIGVFLDFSFDLAFGSGENDFELSVSTDQNVCQEDYFLYIQDTEYGGIIDTIEVDSANREMKYKGRTWHGILNSKVIKPNSGQDYYTVSGDANTILGALIARLSLGTLFRAKSSASGFTLSNYKFKRYVTGYDGIMDMLTSVGAKLHIEYTNDGWVEISAIAIHDYSDDEIDSDHIGFKIKKMYNAVNHLVCLGGGELAQRTVLHLYCDTSGNISTTQTIFGLDEYEEVYDYPNVESVEDLERDGRKRLKELNESDKIEIDLGEEYDFDIGDTLRAVDIITGVSVTRRITKKIVQINKNIVNVKYNVGE